MSGQLKVSVIHCWPNPAIFADRESDDETLDTPSWVRSRNRSILKNYPVFPPSRVIQRHVEFSKLSSLREVIATIHDIHRKQLEMNIKSILMLTVCGFLMVSMTSVTWAALPKWIEI